MVANFHRRGEFPLLRAVKGWDGDTTRNVDALDNLRDLLERSLDAIVNIVQETGSKLNSEGFACPFYRIANRDARCPGGILSATEA